ncbi:MAG: hypothetical protein U0840_11030 [Gemmataceae bacterium]
MNRPFGSSDPPRTLAERLARLSDHLQTLADRLRATIASLVGDTIGEVVHDLVRSLLGGKVSLPDPCRDQWGHHDPASHRDQQDEPWYEEEVGWEDAKVFKPAEASRPADRGQTQRWRNAVSAGLQAMLLFLKHLPRNRPVFATVAVALATGTTGFFAGPTLAAGAGVLTSVVSLLLTADASKMATEFVVG